MKIAKALAPIDTAIAGTLSMPSAMLKCPPKIPLAPLLPLFPFILFALTNLFSCLPLYFVAWSYTLAHTESFLHMLQAVGLIRSYHIACIECYILIRSLISWISPLWYSSFELLAQEENHHRLYFQE